MTNSGTSLVARKTLESSITSAVEYPGMPWKDLRHRAYRGRRPINTAHLSAVESESSRS
jgi:hypothetical protein